MLQSSLKQPTQGEDELPLAVVADGRGERGDAWRLVRRGCPRRESQAPSSQGYIYSVDAPGVASQDSTTIARTRQNFIGQVAFGNPGTLYQYVNANGSAAGDIKMYLSEAQLSGPVKSFERSSCTFAGSPASYVEFVRDIPGDNIIDLGCTPLSENLIGNCPES